MISISSSIIGIDVLNDAVSQLSIAKSRWLPVYVDIATSHIKILDKKACY